MEKYLYFRKDATLTNDDDNANGSVMYPISSLQGIVAGDTDATGTVTGDTAKCSLFFKPMAVGTSAIGAAVSASEGVDLLCYLTPLEHLALPNAEEVKAGLIAYRIAAHAGDLVKLREKAIKWDMKMTEARRTLDWEKQLALS